MSFFGIGPLEILVILVVAFIFLGPDRMTDAARFLAKAVREGRNLASSIPRVVVEDDDVKVVQDGRSTSLTKQESDGEQADERQTGTGADESDDSDTGARNGAAPSSQTESTESDAPASATDDSGPVPFSRRRSPAPPPPAPPPTASSDRDDGQQR